MIETKVRFGFRYRSARKKLNGSFKVGRSVAANAVQFNRGVSRKNRGLPVPPEQAVIAGCDAEAFALGFTKLREEIK
jgi:hypothetical protein